MSKEVIYEVGDLVTTTKGKGCIIYKDKNDSNSPFTDKVDWLYMVEHKEGKWSGPYHYYELNKK